MLQAVKAGKTFSDAAHDAGILPTLSPLVSRTQPDPAMPRQVQQVLFSLKKGEPTMVETPEGFVVATPVEIVAPDPAADPLRYDQLRAAESHTLADDMSRRLHRGVAPARQPEHQSGQRRSDRATVSHRDLV